MNTKYYIAYGSNLNVQQMAWRCPGAKVAGVGTLQDWQLLFRGSRTGSYLTIEPKEGASVPVGVWEITERDEKALDSYEGFPRFYYKRTIPVRVINYKTGKAKKVEALVYIMHEDRPLGVPTQFYVDICAEGYRDFGLDGNALWDAVNRARKAVS